MVEPKILELIEQMRLKLVEANEALTRMRDGYEELAKIERGRADNLRELSAVLGEVKDKIGDLRRSIRN